MGSRRQRQISKLMERSDLQGLEGPETEGFSDRQEAAVAVGQLVFASTPRHRLGDHAPWERRRGRTPTISRLLSAWYTPNPTESLLTR